MSRKQKEITCKESELILLQRMAANELESARVRERAKMILGLLEGKMLKDVASDLGTSKSVVTQWRDRFIEEGPYALYDQERPGRGGTEKKGVHDKVVARINERKEADPPLSAQSLAAEFGVSEATIFRIMDQEDISLVRQRKWYVGYTQAPQPKSTDMVGLYISDKARIMIVCTNHDGLLPNVQGALRTKNKVLADALMNATMFQNPDMVDLLKAAKEYRKVDSVRHSRYDENLFLETAFATLPVDETYEYTIFVYQEHNTPLRLDIPGLSVNLKRVQSDDLWNGNVSLVFDILNTSNWSKRTGVDLTEAIDSFLIGYTEESEPFSWIKRMSKPTGPEGDQSTLGQIIPPENPSVAKESEKIAEVKSYAKCTFEIFTNGSKVVYERKLEIDVPPPEDFDLQTAQFYKDFDRLEELANEMKRQVTGFVTNYLKACADAQGVCGKYKEKLIEAEIGRIPVTVYGDLLSGLRGTESLKSISFRYVVGFLVRAVSYREAADIINQMTHRENNDFVSHRTINDLVKRDFSVAETKTDEFVREVLCQHGFSKKTGKLLKGHEAPQVFQGVDSPGTVGESLLHEAEDYVSWYNSKQEDPACMIDLNNWTGILNEVDCPVLEVSPDGVEGKHQKIHRRTSESEGEKGGETVNTANMHLEVNGKVLAFCARTMKLAFILLLAILLHNNLLATYQIIVFSDGGRDIKKWAEAILGFAKPVIVIDWFHLKKKSNEYFSMALKGGPRYKEARGKIKREFFARLWVGNIDGAIDYLDTIDETMVKNHRRLYEMQEYLKRKRYGITCYALRRHFKLRMSSNKVEKLNDINTSARQKHKGKAWSHDGSYLLTLLSTIFFNNDENAWYKDGFLGFTPKAREFRKENAT